MFSFSATSRRQGAVEDRQPDPATGSRRLAAHEMRLAAGRLLVALGRVRVLFLCAKHLFVAARRGPPRCRCAFQVSAGGCSWACVLFRPGGTDAVVVSLRGRVFHFATIR